MTRNENQNISYFYHLYDYAASKFLQTDGFKLIDPKELNMNEYTSNRSKECALKFNLEYPKELRELRNDYPLALDKTEIKK